MKWSTPLKHFSIVFVEKILRVQPNVKKLYLLLRAADEKSALQRFHNEAIAKDLFRVLREKLGGNLNSLISEKVTLVPGDITCENLGVKDPNLEEEMWREVDVVVNLAATTNFDERYDVSFQLNTMGAKNVLIFSKKCANIKLLLHVSTEREKRSVWEMVSTRPGLPPWVRSAAASSRVEIDGNVTSVSGEGDGDEAGEGGDRGSVKVGGRVAKEKHTTSERAVMVSGDIVGEETAMKVESTLLQSEREGKYCEE
ncbi:hypothetical protein RHGRI_002197 [Rhododendron griersonianum]|uniref:Fatty acyl-CoA reductase n=1 Tax=Rhododendron griersonianum TaxID=479676 RepID=A0AAV6LMZ4_9ERIC|nr:hypothetical protein RHGRI_002197 [Rhododendron griersonianum]